MNRSSWRWIIAPVALLVFAPSVWSQASSPHVGYVYPAGGRQGTTFEVKLGGEYLAGATNLRISGDGVQAKVLGQTRPLTQQEIGALRQQLQELNKKEVKTAADRKEIEEIRKKLATTLILPTPVLAEIVSVEITIDPNATPGPRQLRLKANTGMSNPVVFVVGQLPEISQKKELIDPEVTRPKAPDIKVELPAVLNSQIMPGETDRYRIPARKGQQLVFIARARALIPYLADAVPGWFQAALTLYDGAGKEVAYSDHFQHEPDPVLAYKVPKDGDYVLEIRDALYRGREDFVYRIEAGELPFVTGIFPLGGPATTRTTVALEGWNLTSSSLTVEPADLVSGTGEKNPKGGKAGDKKPPALTTHHSPFATRFLSVRNGDLLSNRVLFAVDTLPECLKEESNNTRETAQTIKLPIIVNGRITKAGAWDVFRFEGKKGQAVVAEVRARRLGSPLDSVLKLTDAAGKIVAYNDDVEDKGQGLQTHHADSFLQVTLPANGTYYLYLGDAQGQGSSAHAYRLRVSAPHPDFELRVTPCSINAQPGSTVAITVTALRRDGFTGEIDLFLTYAPVDFSLGGAKIPANQDEVRVTLQVPATIRPKGVDVVLEGRALIKGKKVVRIATPAEDMMQAFIYHHLVPAIDLMVTVSGQARARFPARLLHTGPIRIRAGDSAQVRIAFPPSGSGNKMQLVLSDPPPGITLKKSQVLKDGAILLVHADGEKVRPGMKGNLIVEVYPAGARPGGGAARRASLGTLPIAFEILKVGR